MIDPDELDEDDAARVVAALWHQVLDDLVHGRPAARAWLDSPQFTYWATLSLPSVAPAEVRNRLLEVWAGRMWARPGQPNCPGNCTAVVPVPGKASG